jgi:hypothetical protein
MADERLPTIEMGIFKDCANVVELKRALKDAGTSNQSNCDQEQRFLILQSNHGHECTEQFHHKKGGL